MKVLVVADVSPLRVAGGAERVLWEVAGRLAGRGHDVRVVSRGGEGQPERITHQGVPVRHFAADRGSLLGFIRSSIAEARRAVGEEVETHEADVLHLHQPLSALGALTSPAGRRLPSLYTFHSPGPLEYRLRRGTSALHRGGLVGAVATALLRVIERASLGRATRIHVLSEFSAGLLWRHYRIGGERVVRIPGGVDVERFRPPVDRAALRRSLGGLAAGPLLFTVRNLEPRMGLDTLLQAVDRLRRRRPDVRLLIGGAGSERARLEALAGGLGLGAHVRFLGFVPDADLPRYYGAADAFVLPTRALEGFGLVTVEALACGTPVLGTPVGATPEILAPLDPALIFRDATAEGMAEDLERFLDGLGRDPAAAERLRQACRAYAEAGYGWEGAVGSLEETLGALAERGRGGLRCPICGAPSLRPDRVHRRGAYWRCPRCDTGMLKNLPSGTRQAHLYEQEYPEVYPHDEVAPRRIDMFVSVLDRLERRNAPGRLLDVGCAGGHLLAEAARRGWRGLGTDVSRVACGVARRSTGWPVFQADSAALPMRGASVDAVALLGLVDLVLNPSHVLGEAHRVLAPGGQVVIRVTNAGFQRPMSTLLRRAGRLGRRWAHHPVLHIYAFTARGLATLAARGGFDVVEVRNSPLTYGDAPDPGVGPGRWVRRFLAIAVRSLEMLSGGRWLLAPSIELYARRPARGGDRS